MVAPDVIRLAVKAKKARVKLCREDFSEFARYVLRDESTGKSIVPGWIHRKWATLIRTHKRIAFLAQTELGKSQQLSIAYTLWRIGRNPRIRVAIVSNSQGMAEKIVRSIQHYILNSKEYAEIFPEIRPGTIWRSDCFEVQREGAVKEATCSAYGLDSRAITGSRFELIIMDDVDGSTSTYTDAQRAKTELFIETSVMSRSSKNMQAIIVGNAWHKEDLIHRLHKNGWPLYVCPAIVSSKVLEQWPDCPYKIGEPLWPEWWSMERLMEYKATKPAREWNRAMLCIPMSDDMSLFMEQDFVKARRRGDGLSAVHSVQQLLEESGFDPIEATREEYLMRMDVAMGYRLPEGATDEDIPAFKIVHGVDLSTGRANDKSAIVTVCVYDDGTRRLLNVQSGHWQGKELTNRLQDTYNRFGGLFVVESIGIQHQIIDLMRDYTMLPMVPFPTTWKDKTIGFSTISAEFAAKKWVIPSISGVAPKEFEETLTGLYDYHPSSHTDDRAMALLFAVGMIRGIESFEGGHSGTVSVSFVGG